MPISAAQKIRLFRQRSMINMTLPQQGPQKQQPEQEEQQRREEQLQKHAYTGEDPVPGDADGRPQDCEPNSGSWNSSCCCSSECCDSSTISTHQHAPIKTTKRSTPRRAKPSNTKNKHVSFGNVQTRCHELIVGDHPFCSTGCPLSLGWKYSDSIVPSMSLDQFETCRCDHRGRSLEDFRTTCKERHEYLREQQSLDPPQDEKTNDNTNDLPERSDHSDYKTSTEIRRACRLQQRHRDRRVRRVEQIAFFQASS